MKPYLLIPIAFSTITLYLLSFIAMHNGAMSKNLHRRIWNILLLFTFLVTVTLGLILTIQVNYKIEIPKIKEILIIHVDFGIAMSFVAIFHFLWHINYYIELLKPGKKIIKQDYEIMNSPQTLINIGKTKLFIFLTVLGFSSTTIQVIMLREFVSVFYSNELIFGIMLAIWLTFTGIGAYSGNRKFLKKYNSKKLLIAYSLPSILAFFWVVLLDLLKNIIFPQGLLIDIWQLLILVFIVLAPGCIIYGRIFSILAEIGQHSEPVMKGSRSYAIESLGSIIGGLIVSLIIVVWLNILQSLVIVIAISLITGYFSLFHNSLKIKSIIIIGSLGIVLLFFIFNIDLKVRQFLFNNQKILVTKETPFGNITITETAGQYNVFENQELLFTSENEIANEEIAHFPMLQNSTIEKVLLISGGVSGIAGEMLKYSTLNMLDCVEINPWLIQLTEKYFKTPADKRLHIYNTDGRRFLELSNEKYNAIIINLPEPSTLQLNRYYTSEFIKIIKNHLSNGAILSINLNSSADYLSTENRLLHSIIYNTLKQEFKNVIVLQGEKDFLLASDDQLNTSIGELSNSSKFKNKYVNSYYMDDRYLTERNNEIQNGINLNAPVNTDFKPVAIYAQTSHFINQFQTKSYFIIIIMIIVLLIPVLGINKNAIGMYVTGFSSASLEMLVIIVFQIMFGFLYAASGILFAIFMTGLVFGTNIKNHNYKFISYLKPLNNQIIMIFITIIVPLCLINFSKYSSVLVLYPMITIALLLPSILIGIQFSSSLLLFERTNKQATAHLYRADLLGSALGFLLTAAVLMPLLGILVTSYFLIAINIITCIIIYFHNRSKN